jgi:pimeloyl-ACP methyl ester carboxylesterase
MTEQRIHRASAADGTEIVGRVYGAGPALVLLPGLGDGQHRPFLVPELSDRFTCYSMSLRGRGLSGDHPDHSPERLVQDVVAFVKSIDERVGLVGHSRGAAQALSAAATADRVVGVAGYEPHAIELYGEDDVERAEAALERMRAAEEAGRVAEAAAIFFEDITLPSEQELAILSESGAFEATAPLMPVIIRDIAEWRLPRSMEALPLDHVSAPVLLLHGTRTHRFYTHAVRRLARRLADARVQHVPDAGHFTPIFAPGSVADEFARFFEVAYAKV